MTRWLFMFMIMTAGCVTNYHMRMSYFIFILCRVPYFIWSFMLSSGYAIQHIWCLSQARINWQGCSRNGIRRKNGGWWRWVADSPVGVAPRRTVSMSASVIFLAP